MIRIVFVLGLCLIAVVLLSQPDVLDGFKKADARLDVTVDELEKVVEEKAGYDVLSDRAARYHLAVVDRLDELSKLVLLDPTNMSARMKRKILEALDAERSARDREVLEAAIKAMGEAGPELPGLPRPPF